MRSLNLFFCASLLSLSACITDQEKEANLFGAQYNLLETSSLPDLSKDTLNVRISYSGCSGNHAFLLRYATKGSSTAEVWLFKVTHDQPCDAYFEQNLSYLLPEKVRNRQQIVLLGPHDKRFAIRP